MKITEFPTRVSDRFYRAYAPDHIRILDLPEAYAELNALYFGGQLPVLRVTEKIVKGELVKKCDKVKWDGRLRTCYGKYYFRGKKIRVSSALKENKVQAYSTLLHEMVHQWLDKSHTDDGIAGHGPNFIKEAMRVNALCKERGVAYRVNFYDLEIQREQATFYCDLLQTEIGSFDDLDIAKRCQAAIKAAFQEGFERRQ